jgi:hypothetical protein
MFQGRRIWFATKTRWVRFPLSPFDFLLEEIDMTFEKEIRKKEIDLIAKKALDKLNDCSEHVFHVLNRYDIDDDEDQEHVGQFKNWKFSSPQNLPVALESLRAKAEKEINKELKKKFGKIPEATVYFISDRVMVKKGFYW